MKKFILTSIQKQLRVVLLLLAVCLSPAAFSQDYKAMEYVQNKVDKIIAESNTAKEAASALDEFIYGKISPQTGERVNALTDRWQSYALDCLKKKKKHLEKWEKQIASGKTISSSDCLTAAKYYMLGLRNICEKNDAKALEFIKLSGSQEPIDKMYALALQYSIDKDINAAKAAMNSIDKPSEELRHVAIRFGLYNIYHERTLALAASQQQTIKRAIRSNDIKVLESFEPYDIPAVDSILANSDVANSSCSDFCWNKCIWIHQMEWTVQDKDIDQYKSLPDYPIMLQFSYFCKEKAFHNSLHRICTDACNGQEKGLLKLIDLWQGKNNIWGYYMISVMAQVFDWFGQYTHDLKLKLYDGLKKLIAEHPSLQNDPELPVTINSNGKVTVKGAILDSFGKKEYSIHQVYEKIYVPLYKFTLTNYYKAQQKQ